MNFHFKGLFSEAFNHFSLLLYSLCFLPFYFNPCWYFEIVPVDGNLQVYFLFLNRGKRYICTKTR